MTTLTLPDYVELNRARALAVALSWTEDGDGFPSPAGDVGGDVQLDGASLSRAFWAELPNGLYARVEITIFIGEAPECRHSDLPADEDKSLHEQVEYLICADRSDPGGTEVNAEYSHNADVAPELRATDANVLDLCMRLGVDDVGWPVHGDRVLRLLTFGLPPVDKATRVVATSSSTQWLFIGNVPIGSITEVEVPDVETLHLAYGHDWNNAGPTPQCTPSGKPDPDYDPGLIQPCTDESEAVAMIVERVPASLSRHTYDAPEAPTT